MYICMYAIVYAHYSTIWVGDLNTTAARNDVSDPDWFAKQFCAAAAAGDRGQPGYTPNEQLRFNELVQAGQLVDVYRHFNPEGTDWTWRGGTGKYHRR
jgi:exonuclease III